MLALGAREQLGYFLLHHVQQFYPCPHLLCIGWHLLPAGAVDAATTMVRTEGAISLYKRLVQNR
jgi:hypothetical protein